MNKKAFTLAEVLITLSILGVVAALTIPALVNRNSDIAAQTRLKKAISAYETAVAVYMAETESATAAGMMGANNAACPNAGDYFKIVATGATGCDFTTADGVAWHFDNNTGNATAIDSATSPRYAVALWNANGRVNQDGQSDGANNYPAALITALYAPAQGAPARQALPGGRHIAAANNFMNNVYFCTADVSINANAISCPQQ